MDTGLIAPCGMNCGVCRAYLRTDNPCHGCRDVEHYKLKTRAQCRLRLCKKRKGRFCYDCTLFPCARLTYLDQRYRNNYRMSLIENLQTIKKFGLRKFVDTEKERWVKGDKVLCVHNRCLYNFKTKNSTASTPPAKKHKTPMKAAMRTV